MSTLGGKVSIRRPSHRMREVLCRRMRLENGGIAPREDNELWAPPSSRLEMESEREKRPAAALLHCFPWRSDRLENSKNQQSGHHCSLVISYGTFNAHFYYKFMFSCSFFSKNLHLNFFRATRHLLGGYHFLSTFYLWRRSATGE